MVQGILVAYFISDSWFLLVPCYYITPPTFLFKAGATGPPQKQTGIGNREKLKFLNPQRDSLIDYLTWWSLGSGRGSMQDEYER